MFSFEGLVNKWCPAIHWTDYMHHSICNSPAQEKKNKTEAKDDAGEEDEGEQHSQMLQLH